MSVLSYIKNLAHRFSRNEIQKSCEITSESLTTHTIPAYVAAVELFKWRKIQSKELKEFATTFKRTCGAKGNELMVETISDSLKNGVVLLEWIYTRSETMYSDQESSLGLTFNKANHLKLASMIAFTNDYARKFLNYAYSLETASADEHFKIATAMAPMEIANISENFINFCNGIKTMQMSVAQVSTNLEALPDAIVTEASEQAFTATIGQARMDPMGFNNFYVPRISVKCNPFYWTAVIVASVQVMQYKCAKEELDLIQLRKLNLEKIYDKKPDARLQQEIEALSNRVSGLNYDLSKMA